MPEPGAAVPACGAWPLEAGPFATLLVLFCVCSAGPEGGTALMGLSLVGAWASTMEAVPAIKAAAKTKVFMVISLIGKSALMDKLDRVPEADRCGDLEHLSPFRYAIRVGYASGRCLGDRIRGVGVSCPERFSRSIGGIVNCLAL